MHAFKRSMCWCLFYLQCSVHFLCIAASVPQIDRILLQLRVAASGGAGGTSPSSIVHTLEMMVRLAWSSPDVKDTLAGGGAIAKLRAALAAFRTSPAVQAAGCLALGALVAGAGDVCLTNQWDIAKVCMHV